MEDKTEVVWIFGKPYPIVRSKFKEKSVEEVLETLKLINTNSFEPDPINKNKTCESKVNASILSKPADNSEFSRIVKETSESPKSKLKGPKTSSKLFKTNDIKVNTVNVSKSTAAEASTKNDYVNDQDQSSASKTKVKNFPNSETGKEPHTYKNNLNRLSSVTESDKQLICKNKFEDEATLKKLGQNSLTNVIESPRSANKIFQLSSDIPSLCSNKDIEDNLMSQVSTKINKNLSISEPLDILAYSKIEWRGKTLKANLMCQGYKEIISVLNCKSVRRVRGDNYCAFRAVAFHIFSQIQTLNIFRSKLKNPSEYISSTLNRVVYELNQKELLENWNFANNIPFQKANVLSLLEQCLKIFSNQLLGFKNIPTQEERLTAVYDFFNADDNLEIYVFEAMKLLMLETSIRMYNQYTNGDEVPTYVWLLFARDTSSKPIDLLKNHLNIAGDTSGLEQVNYKV